MCHLNKAFALPSIPYGSLNVYRSAKWRAVWQTWQFCSMLKSTCRGSAFQCHTGGRGRHTRAFLSAQIISNSLCSLDRWWKLISCLHSHASESPHPWLSVLHNSSVCVTQGCIGGCARGLVTKGAAQSSVLAPLRALWATVCLIRSHRSRQV